MNLDLQMDLTENRLSPNPLFIIIFSLELEWANWGLNPIFGQTLWTVQAILVASLIVLARFALQLSSRYPAEAACDLRCPSAWLTL